MSAPRIASITITWEDRSGQKGNIKSEIDVRDTPDLIGWASDHVRQAVGAIKQLGKSSPPRRGTIRVTASFPIGADLTLDVIAADVPADGDILLLELPVPDRPYDEEEAAAEERRRQAPSAKPAARRREGRDTG